MLLLGPKWFLPDKTSTNHSSKDNKRTKCKGAPRTYLVTFNHNISDTRFQIFDEI